MLSLRSTATDNRPSWSTDQLFYAIMLSCLPIECCVPYKSSFCITTNCASATNLCSKWIESLTRSSVWCHVSHVTRPCLPVPKSPPKSLSLSPVSTSSSISPHSTQWWPSQTDQCTQFYLCLSLHQLHLLSSGLFFLPTLRSYTTPYIRLLLLLCK